MLSKIQPYNTNNSHPAFTANINSNRIITTGKHLIENSDKTYKYGQPNRLNNILKEFYQALPNAYRQVLANIIKG